MRIQSPTLRQCFRGNDVYVVGSGPSMALFPVDFLRGKATIALNQAWKYWIDTGHAPTLGITVHPELVVQYEEEVKRLAKTRNGDLHGMSWAVKKKPPLSHLGLDDLRYFVFNTGPDWGTMTDAPDDTLFIGRGVQQTAMDLAARLGARSVVLVGVDMTDLNGNHHGHEQHVQFHGLPPRDVYAEYRAWTRKARSILGRKYGLPVLSLTPFAGLNAVEDYEHLRLVRNVPEFPEPRDISRYVRKGTDDA